MKVCGTIILSALLFGVSQATETKDIGLPPHCNAFFIEDIYTWIKNCYETDIITDEDALNCWNALMGFEGMFDDLFKCSCELNNLDNPENESNCANMDEAHPSEEFLRFADAVLRAGDACIGVTGNPNLFECVDAIRDIGTELKAVICEFEHYFFPGQFSDTCQSEITTVAI